MLPASPMQDQVRHASWQLSGTVPSSLFYLPFDPAAFMLDWFDRAGIDLPDHIARAARKRQAEYFAGRLCARVGLADFALSNEQIQTGPQRQPLWPPGTVGSITHSRHLAAAMIALSSSCAGLGIDIEDICADDGLTALRDLVVSGHELDLLRPHAAKISWNLLLTLVFSAKESFFKAVFHDVGAYFDFDAITVQAIDFHDQTLAFSVARDLSALWQRGAPVLVHFRSLAPGTIATAFAWG